MKGLYAQMHEDAVLQDIVEEIIYTVSFSMLSEGKTVEEIVEVLGSDDENIIIEKYEKAFKSKTLTEDFDFEYHAEDIALIYEGLGSLAVKGLWKAGKGLFGLVPKAVRLGGRVIKPVVDAGKRTVKKILGPRLVKKLKPAAAVTAGTGAAIATGAAVMNALDKDEKPEKKEEKPEVKTTDSLPDKVKDTEKPKLEKPEINFTGAASFPDGIPSYTPQKPKPTKDTETLPDRAPSQLGDKTPYSKKATEKMSKRTRRILSGQSVYDRDPRAKAGRDPRYEAYDVVLDYLLSEGHAETVEEAHYVMMQMDAEHIQSIVESGYFPTKKSQREDEAKYNLSRDRLPGEHKPQKPEKKVEEQMMPPIDPEKHKQAQKTQKIYNKAKGGMGSEKDFLKKTGPQLPGGIKPA